MKPFTPFFGLPLGISSSFWFLVGLIRYMTERIGPVFKKTGRVRNKFTSSDIAAIIPAHNEELVIRACIGALKCSLDKKQIYVVSDGSNDKTYRRARMEDCHVSKLYPSHGKAKAITYVIRRFHLYERYKLIFIVDADTRIDKFFVKRALPLFNDPETSVMFGSAGISWPKHWIPKVSLYYVAYRERLNRILQFFFVYGQTWKYTNVMYVIPGFATIYRSSILQKLNIDTPGLLIEDFNTAFQLHKRRLGKIAYHPECIGWDQHPETLSDYWRQVQRWNIGFFQTVKLNGIWPSWYWLSLGIFSLEIFLNSLFILLLPLLIFYFMVSSLPISHPALSSYSWFYGSFGPFRYVQPVDLLKLFFVVDYGLTVILGLLFGKVQFVVYGLFFFFMHYVTSLILIVSVIPGFSSTSLGKWTSPKRSPDQLSVKI